MLASFTWLFLSFNGRITRQEFRLGLVATVVIELLVMHLLQNAGSDPGPFYFTSGAMLARHQHQLDLTTAMSKLVAAGMLLWPRAALLLKRMHDLGFSAKWLLLWPGIIALAMLTDLAALSAIVATVALLVLALLPGVRGANEFGADPLPRP